MALYFRNAKLVGQIPYMEIPLKVGQNWWDTLTYRFWWDK